MPKGYMLLDQDRLALLSYLRKQPYDQVEAGVTMLQSLPGLDDELVDKAMNERKEIQEKMMKAADSINNENVKEVAGNA